MAMSVTPASLWSSPASGRYSSSSSASSASWWSLTSACPPPPKCPLLLCYYPLYSSRHQSHDFVKPSDQLPARQYPGTRALDRRLRHRLATGDCCRQCWGGQTRAAEVSRNRREVSSYSRGALWHANRGSGQYEIFSCSWPLAGDLRVVSGAWSGWPRQTEEVNIKIWSAPGTSGGSVTKCKVVEKSPSLSFVTLRIFKVRPWK